MVDEVLDRPAVPPPDTAGFPFTVPVRRIRGGDLNTLLDREWLVTNGLGGYASRHGRRRRHPALPRPARSPPCRPRSAGHDAQPPLRAPPPAGLAAASPFGGEERVGGDARRRTAPSTWPSSGWRPACRSGGTRSTGTSSRSASSCRTGRTRCTSATGCSTAPGPVRLKLRPSVHFRGARRPGQHAARRRRTLLTAVDEPLRAARPGGRCRRCGCA